MLWLHLGELSAHLGLASCSPKLPAPIEAKQGEQREFWSGSRKAGRSFSCLIMEGRWQVEPRLRSFLAKKEQASVCFEAGRDHTSCILKVFKSMVYGVILKLEKRCPAPGKKIPLLLVDKEASHDSQKGKILLGLLRGQSSLAQTGLFQAFWTVLPILAVEHGAFIQHVWRAPGFGRTERIWWPPHGGLKRLGICRDFITAWIPAP